jgi:hypothetical protein
MVEIEGLKGLKLEDVWFSEAHPGTILATTTGPLGVSRSLKLQCLDHEADEDNIGALTSFLEHVQHLFESVASLPHLDRTASGPEKMR